MGNNRGGLVSTLNDLVRLFRMIARKGRLCNGECLLSEKTVEMMNHDWLSMPECLGNQQYNDCGLGGVTAEGLFGWNAMGELGVVADPKKLSFGAFELGEFGYGSMAEAFYSINPRRDMIIIWITQQVDNHSWTESQPKADLWTAARDAETALSLKSPPIRSASKVTAVKRNSVEVLSSSPLG